MQTDEQEIRKLVHTWLEATKAGDHETVVSLMADDVVFLLPGYAPMIGKANCAAVMKPPQGKAAPHIDGAIEIQEIVINGDWAFMWTNLTIVITPPGSPGSLVRAGNTLSVLKKVNGKWLLARDANLLVNVPPPSDSQAAG